MRKEKVLFTGNGSKLVQILWKSMWNFLKKIKNRNKIKNKNLLYNLVMQLVSKYLKESSSLHRDTCVFMFTTAMFIIGGEWEQPSCPSPDE